MATVTQWNPFGVSLNVTATAGTVTRTSATQFTVKINASWETYWSGNQTNYGMTASSGGGSVTLNPFGTKSSGGSGSFTGTYSISGNGSATKSITVTFKNFNSDNGKSATKTVSFNVTVPAWTSYTIKYNANGGSGAPGNQTKWKDQTLTLSSTKPTRTGYSFLGWSTSSSATSAIYSAGGKYTANAAATLYAVWKANTYTIKYNGNASGVTNVPSNQTKTYGVTLKLSSTIPTREYYNFLGWSTSASATSPTYKAGSNYVINSAATLYAVWELAYMKPRITEFTIRRADNADGEIVYSDMGTSVHVVSIFECDEVFTSVKLELKDASGTVLQYEWGSNGETHGAITDLVLEGQVSTDKSYTAKLEVTDSKGSGYAILTVPGSAFVMDVRKGGKGASFGKPAELDDVLDSAWAIKPSGGFINIPIEEGTDFDTLTTPNTYVSYNKVANTYTNCPITTGTFKLEVTSGGNEGQVIQTLTYASKDATIIWQRFYYSSAWGDWHQTYTAAGNVLWSGASFMHDTQEITFAQKVSEQPNGIRFVFSCYNNGASNNSEWWSHDIPKHMIINHPSGGGYSMSIISPFAVACKYLYITDTGARGYADNDDTITIGGVTCTNNRYVLRYVIGY